MTTRRQALALVLALGGAAQQAVVKLAHAHNDVGRVQPALPAPALPLTLQDGRRSTLPRLLAGQATALQLMFTGCSATCPIQGALFGAVQQRIHGRPGVQLLSVSVDPLGDDAPAMQRWMQQFGAGTQWRGALPAVADVDKLFDFLRARSREPDRHTAQVYFFNTKGELALRSTDFPSAEQVASMLVAAQRSV